ncbi:hypothetical protein HQ587_03525 [bacterium]|nr:hypothetical protein [bacterium]
MKTPSVSPFMIILTTGLLIINLTGCSSRSTGILNQPGKRGSVPDDLPERVVVLPLAGDVRVTGAIADRLEDELYLTGFDVVRFAEIEAVFSKSKITPIDFTQSENWEMLTMEFDVGGIFSGKAVVMTGESGETARLEMEFINIVTGQMLWRGEAKDPRWLVISGDERESVPLIVDKIMKLLKKDMKKFDKAKRKQEKRNAP